MVSNFKVKRYPSILEVFLALPVEGTASDRHCLTPSDGNSTDNTSQWHGTNGSERKASTFQSITKRLSQKKERAISTPVWNPLHRNITCDKMSELRTTVGENVFLKYVYTLFLTAANDSFYP